MNKVLKILIIGLFVVLPFGQLTRLPIFYSGVNIYLWDIIIVAIITVWLLGKPKIKSSLLKPIIFFITAAVISLVLALFIFSSKEVFIASLYLVRWLSYSSLYFVLKEKNLKLPIKKMLIYSASLLAVFGITQYLIQPDTRFLASANWDDHYYRVIATLGDPSFVGIILLLGLILLPVVKAAWWLYPIFLIPMLLTYSRSTYLALIAASTAWAIVKKNYKIILIAVLLLALVLPFMPRPGGEGVKLERLFSISQRFENYGTGWGIFKQSPLVGVGFNTLRYQHKKIDSNDGNRQISHAAAGLDSSLMFVLATTGIIGFVAYLYLIFHLWKGSMVLKISLVAILVHSLFQNTLFYPWVMIWLWSLVATEYS